ncbi:hypothetical protein EI94DRAFT_822090 [Lactarius quietus]|nr:hypothetical protein EI94DRAFT_822090 [Lactarius quietus]
MVSLALSDITLLTANILPSDVLELVQQTLDILSETFPAEVTIELPPDWPNTLINVSGNKYDRVIVSRLGYLLQTCVSSSSTLTDEVRGNCLQMSLKSLWNYAKVYHQLGTSESLPPYFLHVLATPEITHHIRREEGTTSRVLRYCFEVLVVTKLAADFNSRAAHVSDRELACLSTIFGTQSYVVEMLLRIPGAIEHMGLFFLVLSEAGILNTPFHTPMPTMFPYPAREPIPMFPYPTPIPTMFPYPTPNPAMFPYSEPLPAGYPYPSSMPIRDGHPSSMPTRARYPSTMHLGDRYPSTMPTRARYPATMPLGDRYPSTMPTRARYPATMPLGGPYSSTMPTRARYPPTIPLGDHYPSTMPTRARYSSTMPTGAHYPTPMPTGSHYPIPNPTIPSTHVPTMSTNHIYPLRPPSIIFTIPSHPSSVSRSSFNSERAPFPFPTPMFPFRSTAPVNPHITVTPTASSIPSPSTSQISLASMSRISDGEQSDLWDVVQQTFAILSLTLPAGRDTQPWLDQMHNQVGKSDGELKTILQHWLHDLLKMCTIEFPLPESEERIGCLKSLWYHEIASYYLRAPGSLPTLDLFPLHFFTPEIAHRIHAEEDNVVRVIGRCFASLVVNRRAVKSKPFEDHELGYLTAILSTENRAAIHQHFTPGVVQLINVVFLAFGEVSSFVTNTTPPYVLHIVGQTIGILTQSLPAELSAGLQLNRAESRTNVPDSLIKSVIVSYLRDLFKVCTQRTFPLPEAVRMHCVQMCLYGLWCWGKVLHQLDASQPLPPEFVDLAGLEITGHTRTEVDKVTRVMGSCVEALVVKNLVVRMNSRTDSDSTFQISDKELACVSAILGTESHDLRLWLSRPGAVELATEVSLVFSEIDMLFTYTPPSDVLDMVQETCNLVSFQVPYELYAELLKSFEGLQPLTEPNHSPLRQSLKRLWQSAKACNALGISVPLPSFVPITLASPEFTRCLHMERDLPTRVIGRCAQALIVNKLVDDFQSHISLSIGVYDAELASISSLLAIEPGEFSRWPRPSAVIKLQNIVFLMSGEIENLFSSSETTPTDALHVVQQTLNVVCSDLVLGGVFASGDLPMDQIRLLREIRSKIANVHVNQFSVQTVAEISDQLLTAEILDELQQLLKHMPTVELKMRRCTSTIFDLKSVRDKVA